jgi:hypothetical protein
LPDRRTLGPWASTALAAACQLPKKREFCKFWEIYFFSFKSRIKLSYTDDNAQVCGEDRGENQTGILRDNNTEKFRENFVKTTWKYFPKLLVKIPNLAATAAVLTPKICVEIKFGKVTKSRGLVWTQFLVHIALNWTRFLVEDQENFVEQSAKHNCVKTEH